uniref:ShKT domain-containing protein n=1 Tax=Ditylenchus dipsaci TaxID=166011 RepID=A0A915E589_9BILA
MHYDSTAFGKMDPLTRRPMVTMVPVKEMVMLTDNLVLTHLDAQKLKILGKCADLPKPKTAITAPDFLLEEQPSIATNSVIEHNINTHNIQVTEMDNSASQDFHRLICNDRSQECEKFRVRGFCSNYRYKRLMKVHCRNTCKFCHEPHSEENETPRKMFENRIS